MKSITLVIGCILIAINLLLGMLLSSYNLFNIWFNTIVLAFTTLFILIIHSIKLLDAVKISLTILFVASGLLKLLLGTIAPEHIQDNLCVIVCIFLTLFEIIITIIYRKVPN